MKTKEGNEEFQQKIDKALLEMGINSEIIDINKIEKTLKELEIPLKDINGNYRNLEELLKDLNKKYNKIYKLEGEKEMSNINIGNNNTIVNSEIGGEDKMKLQVRYIDKNITPMKKIEGGDLVDLRVSRVFKNGEETTFPCKYRFGDTLFFKLGFAMKMPPNKKANVYPRSGMFKNYGFLLTNSVGQIDNKFQGNEDEWCAMMWCTRDGEINYDDRILQFEVVNRVMENVEFEIVEQLGEVNRGGYSSTGVK